jgi:hypothetical protein
MKSNEEQGRVKHTFSKTRLAEHRLIRFGLVLPNLVLGKLLP